jgi:protein-disulfide isomerase
MNSYTYTRYSSAESRLTLIKVSCIAAALFVATLIMSAAAPVWAAPASADLEMAIGQDDAPITIIEYASLSCPHCARFHELTLPLLQKKYIDTGKVRLVFRAFPLERTAFWASIIARCAGEKRYFAFVDVFFKKQQSWFSAEDPFKSLLQIARLGGLSANAVKACTDDTALGDGILKTRLDGEQKHEVSSTPSFVIDGKTYRGALTMDQLDEIITPLLP